MGLSMNISKLFLAFSIMCLGFQMPMQAAGIAYKPAALMAAASTASAVLANGVIAIAESIKKEKLFKLSGQVAQLLKENDSLSLENNRLQRLAPEFMPNEINGPSPYEILAFCMVVVGALYLFDLYDEKPEFGPQPITYKEESTISNI